MPPSREACRLRWHAAAQRIRSAASLGPGLPAPEQALAASLVRSAGSPQVHRRYWAASPSARHGRPPAARELARFARTGPPCQDGASALGTRLRHAARLLHVRQSSSLAARPARSLPAPPQAPLLSGRPGRSCPPVARPRASPTTRGPTRVCPRPRAQVRPDYAGSCRAVGARPRARRHPCRSSRTLPATDASDAAAILNVNGSHGPGDIGVGVARFLKKLAADRRPAQAREYARPENSKSLGRAASPGTSSRFRFRSGGRI